MQPNGNRYPRNCKEKGSGAGITIWMFAAVVVFNGLVSLFS